MTADLDYPRLLALSQADGPLVILFRRGDFSEDEARERLGVVLDRLREEDLTSSIVVVERPRIRRRRLPLRPAE